MKEQPKMGVNRTGMQMSPFDSGSMKDASQSTMPPPGDMPAVAEMRSYYINEADELGSVPPPGTLKGVMQTGMSMMTGNMPQLLLDKLGERLAFERTGTRLYEGLITKVRALADNGTATLPIERLEAIRDEEAQHFALVANAIQSLGGDPTCQTPCADVAGVESQGLLHTISDPRTSVAQSLHAILVAEMTDNNGWEMLIALAENQNHSTMASDFATALQHEREHLRLVQSWFEEATLGAPLARDTTQSGVGTPLH